MPVEAISPLFASLRRSALNRATALGCAITQCRRGVPRGKQVGFPGGTRGSTRVLDPGPRFPGNRVSDEEGDRNPVVEGDPGRRRARRPSRGPAQKKSGQSDRAVPDEGSIRKWLRARRDSNPGLRLRRPL